MSVPRLEAYLNPNDIYGYVFWVVPGFSLIFFIFAYLANQAIDHVRAKNWPQCTGKIVESFVDVGGGGDGGRPGTPWIFTGENGPSFTPCIRFTYHAAGLARESRHFAFHCWAGSHARSEATVARYPVGSSVIVHYNPKRPDQAVLETGHAGYSVALATAMGLLFFFMVGALLGVFPVSGGS